MGLLDCAGYRSVFRGYDYFKANKVQNLVQVAQTQYSAQVLGRSAIPYEVLIDVAHPRKSKCNCPHADGRRVVCKHMIAVYLSVFPDEAKPIHETILSNEMDNAYDEWDEYDCESDEDGEEEEGNPIIECVCSMNRSELQQALLQVLFDGPEWQYDRFLEEHCSPFR